MPGLVLGDASWDHKAEPSGSNAAARVRVLLLLLAVPAATTVIYNSSEEYAEKTGQHLNQDLCHIGCRPRRDHHSTQSLPDTFSNTTVYATVIDQPVLAAPDMATLDAEILAALWEEVPFPRLPHDAPSELSELVVEIENPRRVYSIHRATRRHNLQLLVEKFMYQLRYGCGSEDCPTASCFSCRRRLAGKAPIRRYSPMSARTLAVHLASQDNPEQYLCPNLESRRGPADAIKPLIFGPKPRVTRNELGDSRRMVKRTNGGTRLISVEERERIQGHLPTNTESATARSGPSSKPCCTHQRSTSRDGPNAEHGSSSAYDAGLKVSINERPVRKDYRSFAANVFGTVAFKMVEWLAPHNIDAISEKASAALENRNRANAGAGLSTAEESEDDLFVASSSSGDLEDMVASESHDADHEQQSASNSLPRVETDTIADSRQKASQLNGNANGSIHPTQPRTTSSARVRTSSKAKSLSVDHIPQVRLDESIHVPVTPLPLTSKVNKPAKSLTKTPSGTAPRWPSGQLTNGVYEEQKPLSEQYGSDRAVHEPPSPAKLYRSISTGESVVTSDKQSNSSQPRVDQDQETLDAISDADVLPQSISRLNTQVVDFLCDVLQQDGTTETHLLEPHILPSASKSSIALKAWKRRRCSATPYPRHLKLEWKLFVEQSIFNVLSDPFAILASFTTQDGLIDSQTLWYHMLRMTRAAPTLVFDSLWQASANLFAPPNALRSARVPTANLFSKHMRPMSNEEAGSLLSVCLHALVAAAPLVEDSSQLFDMSRIRSRGLTLSESGAVARQPSSLCLQYEDAFTDDMAIRLARRVLAAIPTRKYFDGLAELDVDSEDAKESKDVLDVLLSHLEPGRETQSSISLPYADRELHEKRVPILLLDWARTIMLNEWQGRPDVPGDGPFGGALSLIAAMHQKRKSLLLGDAVFRTEYFGDRLDSIEMPVTWLTFDTTKQKAHLLDYPFIFHPSSLVSYFRAINFSRMSRAYEESSSLQTRISAIVAPESLVTDQHQKGVLQDLLKIASAKFLILDIGRKTVIRDAFDQLWRRQERELSRPLKVHLGEDTGEEGFDSGGVQQEFFRLAIAEALNPDYGAFTVDDRTRMTWFQPGSLQPEWKFELVGLLISLAVFNGLTLPITFPKALYMKLLSEPVTELHHIADGWPDLGNGLTTLLEWDETDGAVEDIFARTYEFSIDTFGQPVSRQMESSKRISWPQFSRFSSAESLASDNPEDAPLVTADNREAYVSDYIRYLTDVSIAPQYEAFARGFRTCLNAKSLQLFTPPLLQSIVEGTQEIDIAELRRAARYVGWDASHRTVRDFWSIVKRYDDRMKRKLLEFVTASDRVPVGGMRNVQFVVQRNGAEEGENGHLPTAYTCYGTLLLPEYRDKEVLKERLGMALENAQGFGFA
ncbi:HECT-domain-containing protein [Seiridium cupressi]